MSGYVNDKGVGHNNTKAESIAKSAYMKYGKSNGQSAFLRVYPFIMSKLIQHDITVAQLDDEAFGEESPLACLRYHRKALTAYDSWSEVH